MLGYAQSSHDGFGIYECYGQIDFQDQTIKLGFCALKDLLLLVLGQPIMALPMHQAGKL